MRNWPEHLALSHSLSFHPGDGRAYCFAFMSTFHGLGLRNHLEIMSQISDPAVNILLQDHHQLQGDSDLQDGSPYHFKGAGGRGLPVATQAPKWDVVRSQDKGYFLSSVSLISAWEGLRREVDRNEKTHTIPSKDFSGQSWGGTPNESPLSFE